MRPALDGMATSSDLGLTADGSRLDIAGLVVARQRPATARGVVFMLLEDEEGVVNVVVPPPVYANCRLAVRTASFAAVSGKLERREGVINVVAARVTALATPTSQSPTCVRSDGRPTRRPHATRKPNQARLRLSPWARSRPPRPARTVSAGGAEDHDRRRAMPRFSLVHAVFTPACKGSCTRCRSVRGRPYLYEPMFDSSHNSFAERLANAVDLVVDFATLGEYGLEPLPADGRCELDGLRAGWEAAATSRRGSCRARRRRANRAGRFSLTLAFALLAALAALRCIVVPAGRPGASHGRRRGASRPRSAHRGKKQHCSDHRSQEAAEVELVLVTDAEHLREDQNPTNDPAIPRIIVISRLIFCFPGNRARRGSRRAGRGRLRRNHTDIHAGSLNDDSRPGGRLS